MMKLGVAQWCLGKLGLDSVWQAADFGFSAIQIDAGDELGNFPKIDEPSIQRAYVQAAESVGVSITGVAIGDLDIFGMTAPDGSPSARKCWNAIRRAIDGALAMRVPLVYLSSFEDGEIRSQADLERTATVIARACEYAQGEKITIATENTLGAADQRRLVQMVGDKRVRVLIDTLNPILWGFYTPELINDLWDLMCDQVHVKDGTDGQMGNAPLGAGMGHVRESLEVLHAREFRGYLILENEYYENIGELSRADIKALRHMNVVA